jgi:hypothetical protein
MLNVSLSMQSGHLAAGYETLAQDDERERRCAVL